MASGYGLSPEQQRLLLQALSQGGDGLANPMAALQNILQAQGGQSAAQAIVASLRNKLIPQGPAVTGSPMARPATVAARGLLGAEPNYAKIDDEPAATSAPVKSDEKRPDDIAEAAKKLADQTPARPAGNGILGKVSVPAVPDVPAANVAVNRAVSRDAIGSRAYDLLIKTTAAEAGNQGSIGRVAVAHSILNRVQDGRYGDGIEGVILKPSQYEPLNAKNRARTLGLSPDSPQYQAAKADVDRVLSGEAPDPTNGATHFLNKATVTARGGGATKAGGWATRGSDQVQIGAHTFMKADAGRGPGPGPVGRAQLSDRANLAGQMARPTTPDGLGPVRTSGILADQNLQAPTAPIPSFGGAGRRPVSALIVHHTGGEEQTPEDVKAVYQERGLTGAHLFMDRQGNVSQTLGFDQAGQHIRNGQGAGRGLSNANTIGIEVSAKDDSDITPEQRAAMAKLYPQLQQQFPGLKVFGHGEINPHKQETEGATIVNDLRNLGKPSSEQTAPVPIADRTGPTTQDPNTVDNPDFPKTDTDLGPDFGASMDIPKSDTDLGTDFDAGSIGGLLGGLGGLAGGDGSGADSAPSMLDQWDKQDAAEEKKPDKPLIPEEDKQAGGLLDQDQEKTDLARVFAPDRFGGTGLLGRDQAPETTGFKAPVGLPTAGANAATPTAPAVGILSGAPPRGVASMVPPQLKSMAQAAEVPLPPRRPADLGAGIDVPTLAPPQIEVPARPKGLLADAGNLGIPAPPIADTLLRPPTIAPPAPSSPGLLGPGMGGPNPPWQDPPSKPSGILGAPAATPNALGAPDVGGLFDKLTKNAGILSSAFGAASGGMGQPRKRPSETTSRPIAPPDALLGSGLLASPRQGIDLNRFFGLLSGRMG